jgi:hypothetical protein
VKLQDLTDRQIAALRRELEDKDREEGRAPAAELLFECPGARLPEGRIEPCTADGGRPFRSPTLAGVCEDHGVHVQ